MRGTVWKPWWKRTPSPATSPDSKSILRGRRSTRLHQVPGINCRAHHYLLYLSERREESAAGAEAGCLRRAEEGSWSAKGGLPVGVERKQKESPF